MKRKINVFEYAEDILKQLPKGVLLTTQANDKVNSMVIGWGTLGIEWGKPIFITFVREHRFTHELLESNGEFTINIPMGDFDKNILTVCGSQSGRHIDKITTTGLTLVNSEILSVPAIKEFPLTLECKLIYQQTQVPEAITDENKIKFHPQDVDSSNPMANKDFHTAFYGQIVDAYIIE